MGNGETRNLACPYSTYPGKGRRDGVWTGNRGVTKASPASGSTKAQEGTARLGVKEGVKPEVWCDRHSPILVAYVIPFWLLASTNTLFEPFTFLGHIAMGCPTVPHFGSLLPLSCFKVVSILSLFFPVLLLGGVGYGGGTAATNLHSSVPRMNLAP
uniref:Uncharacterized protein n=1 Tax=Oryza brachyantha TaxID=4533 RepID=J3KV65_ORYBR